MRTNATAMTIGRLLTPTLELVHELGVGGMGKVWAANHLALGSPVAVKMLLREYIDDDASIVRFKQEAQRAARVRSPHVATVFDHGMTAEGEPYIVMELLEGEPLHKRIKRNGALPLDEIEILVRQTAKALTTAHKLGVVHRDIKPANLFVVDNEGEPFIKVVDFGIAKQMDAPPDLTTTSTWLGSPPYMSPEQFMNPKKVDFRTDLWSLGVVVYEALTGMRPFIRDSKIALALAITSVPFTLPSTLRMDLPTTIDDWMKKALAKKHMDRFGSAKEMADALIAILHPSIVPDRPSSLPSIPPPPIVFHPPPNFSDDPPAETIHGPLVDDEKTIVDRHGSSLPPPQVARRSDIQAPPFPVERAPLLIARTFDPVMVARLENGFLPRSENDKWFAFMEGDHVYFHRSQTGDPVYEVILEPLGDGKKRIAQAWVAANKKNTLQNENLLARLFDELFFDGSPASARGPAQRIWVHEGDLTTLTMDAIVNSADPSLLGGMGIDGDIHRAAGSGLLTECKALGKCNVGEAKMTKGHSLPVKHVIHTVGPNWRGGSFNERNKLASCYANSLALAAKANLRTVAFPSIATGTKRFPLDEAATIAAQTTHDFFARKTSVELVIFCTFTPEHTEAARAGLAHALNR